jgi:hypothetical protein
MDLFLSSLLIFGLRIVDVSLDTIRIVFLIQSRRWLAGALGLVQSFVFIFAVAQVFQNLDEPLRMVGYASGFAAGTVLGSSIERWIGMGHAIVRVIAPFDTPQAAGRRLRGHRPQRRGPPGPGPDRLRRHPPAAHHRGPPDGPGSEPGSLRDDRGHHRPGSPGSPPGAGVTGFG